MRAVSPMQLCAVIAFVLLTLVMRCAMCLPVVVVCTHHVHAELKGVETEEVCVSVWCIVCVLLACEHIKSALVPSSSNSRLVG